MLLLKQKKKKKKRLLYALNNKLSFSDALFYSLALFVLWFTVSLARAAKSKWEGDGRKRGEKTEEAESERRNW